MKKTACLLLASLLVAAVVGCGKKAEITNTEIKISAPITIKFSHWSGKNAFTQIYAKFKQIEPDIAIKEELIPSNEYMDILQTRLSGGTAPDLFGINGVSSWAVKFNNDGFLEPLNDVSELGQVEEAFTAISKDASGNQFVGVWNSVNFGLFYNEQLFAAAGVQPPATWQQFLDVCGKLQAQGIRPLALGGKDAFTLNWVLSYIQANEQYVKEPDAFERINRREAKFSDLVSYRRSIEKFQTLISEDIIGTDSLGVSYNDSLVLFAEGKAAMVAGGAFSAPAIRGFNAEIKMGALPIPGEKGERNTFGVPGTAFGINKASSDEAKEAAKKFLAFLFDEQVSKAFSEQTALFTTLKDVKPDFSEPAEKAFASLPIILETELDPAVVDAATAPQLWSDLQGMVAGKVTIEQLLENQDGRIK